MFDPSGPMLKGMTYIVRPRMQPAKSLLRDAFISFGFTQLFVGPASSFLTLQMKVRSSTLATSLLSERARKLLGRFFSFSRMKVPDSTSLLESSSDSASEPSHQWIAEGRQRNEISRSEEHTSELQSRFGTA